MGHGFTNRSRHLNGSRFFKWVMVFKWIIIFQIGLWSRFFNWVTVFQNEPGFFKWVTVFQVAHCFSTSDDQEQMEEDRTDVFLSLFLSASSFGDGKSSNLREIHLPPPFSAPFVKCKSSYPYRDLDSWRNVGKENSFLVVYGSHICVWTIGLAGFTLFNRRRVHRIICSLLYVSGIWTFSCRILWYWGKAPGCLLFFIAADEASDGQFSTTFSAFNRQSLTQVWAKIRNSKLRYPTKF